MKYFLGWVAIILFFGGLVVGGLFLVKNVSTDVFSYKEVEELNYGDYDITDLVKQKVECKKNECIFKKKKVEFTISEVKSLGKQKIDLEIEYDKEKYKHTFEVNIIDKKAPEIVLSEKYAVLNVNSKWNAKSYITSVLDNYDELSIDDIEIEDNVNAKKIGDYEVIYKIKDSSGNEGKSTLKVMIKDPKTVVEIPKEDIPSTPTVKENEKFEAKVSTTGIYDFNNTLNQDNKTGSVTKEITVGWSSQITFNIDLKGSGAYSIGWNISDKDETPSNAKDFTCGAGIPSSYCYKDTIDSNHKFSYTFKNEGTYYIYIVLKDRMNNITLEQKIKLIIKDQEKFDAKILTTDKSNYVEIDYNYIGDPMGEYIEIGALIIDSDDNRLFDDSTKDNVLVMENDEIKLYYKSGCYYKIMVMLANENEDVLYSKTITIQK